MVPTRMGDTMITEITKTRILEACNFVAEFLDILSDNEYAMAIEIANTELMGFAADRVRYDALNDAKDKMYDAWNSLYNMLKKWEED